MSRARHLNKRHLFMACLLVCVGAFCCAPSAMATRNVTGPAIKADALQLELRNGLEFDDRRSIDRRITQQLFVDYGLTDRVAMRVTGYGTKQHHDDYHFSSYEGELRYELLEPEESWLNLATRLRYQHEKTSSRADTASLALLAQTTQDQWVFTANAQTSWQLGSNRTSGASLLLSAQALYQWDERLNVGAEWFGSLGNLRHQAGYSAQQHQLGPVATLKLDQQTALQFGYLQGVSHSASDSLIKFFISRKF